MCGTFGVLQKYLLTEWMDGWMNKLDFASSILFRGKTIYLWRLIFIFTFFCPTWLNFVWILASHCAQSDQGNSSVYIPDTMWSTSYKNVKNSSCFTLLVMTWSSTSYWERSVRILQAPLFDTLASPWSLVCKLLFCPGEDSFSTFACDLPTPDPTGPDSHLLGSEPNPIRDPWPTSLQFHQPM